MILLVISLKAAVHRGPRSIKVERYPNQSLHLRKTFSLKYSYRLISCMQNAEQASIKAVIFDLDGTLSSFNLDYKTVRAKIKAFLEQQGVPNSLLSEKDGVLEMIGKTEEWARGTDKPSEFIEEAKAQASAISEKHELEAALKTSLLPGVKETLKTIRKTGLKIGLCTINSTKSVACILERFDISQFFDVVITRNQVTRVKPHPEHIEAALRVLEIGDSEAIVVGDSSIDMKSAFELKMIAVGLPTGTSTVDQLKNSGAHYIITSMLDLPVLIQEINTSRQNTPHEQQKERSQKPEI
jgi:phosphoglycolate phosphatase